MRALLYTIFATLLITSLVSCKDELKDTVKVSTDPERVPSMVTRDVQTVISDSGITRYRVTASLWNMYEEAKTPHWIFPDGMVAEELDSNYKVIATLRCDSAYYNRPQQRWSLNGNVRITNVDNDLILTNQMFWDQSQHTVYSDSFIHIERQMRVIEGYGYSSNEQFTTYSLKRVSAIFPVDDSRMPRGGATTLPVDPSAATNSDGTKPGQMGTVVIRSSK